MNAKITPAYDVPKIPALCLLLLASSAFAGSSTFTNPLLPSGADPWVTSRARIYYYMQTTGNNLTVWETRDITDLKNARTKIVWTPPPSGPFSHDIWAPELHFLRGKWYIYFAADDGSNNSHRIWVLENESADPLEGTWTFKGKLTDPSDKWAIDATVFEDDGKLYEVWSGWPGDKDGEQDLYIARMDNPWTIMGDRFRISMPELPWEMNGNPPKVNEGPEILRHKNKLLLVYSASGCWTDSYTLGMLVASAKGDLLSPQSWKKVPHPMLAGFAPAHAFATGHNSFFKSPDGKQDWILYHANPEAHQGCGSNRSPRAQRFTWDKQGFPQFGPPAVLNEPFAKPSGTDRVH